MSFSDWSNKKKKKTTESFSEWSNNKYGITEDDDDIAPLPSTVKKEDDERKWFQKGAFEDGYQFGDVTKTMEGTALDIRSDLMQGVLGIGEGVVDAGATLVGGVGKLFGADMFADTMSNFVKKDIIDEEAIARKIIRGTNTALISTIDIDDYEEESVLGEKSDSLVQSGGQLVGQIGLQAVGVPWYLTSGVTSFGSTSEEAFKNDATYGEAIGSGVISAGAEILSEKLFGGSGLGEKGLLNVQALTKGISNKVVKSLVDYGIDVAGEGAEEAISEFFGNLGSALYREENLAEILGSEEAIDGYIEAAIGGAFLGGTMNSVKVGSSVKNKTDYHTELTANEERVFNAVLEERLAEKGENISKREEQKMRDDLLEEIKTGRIDTDTIERILGDESYKVYKATTKQETSLTDRKNAIESEIESLVGIPKEQITVGQDERLKSLRAELEKVNANLGKVDVKRAKNNLFNDVNELTANDTFLRESYRQREKRGEAFTADLNKYKGKQREAVQRAIDSGVLNDTYRSHELVDILSRLEAEKGIVFDYTNNEKLLMSGMAIKGKTINGFEKDGVVTLNVQSSKAWQSTVGHEITHVLEGTGAAYDSLQSVLFELAESKGEYQSRYDALVEMYKGVKGYETDFEAKIKKELTADLVGDYLFSDKAFIDRLVGNRTLFQKVWDEIKYLCKVATGKELTEIEKVNREFDRAWKEHGKVAEEEAYNEEEEYNEPALNFSISVTDKATRNFLDEQVARGEYDAETNPDGGYYVTYKSMSFWGYDEDGNAILRSPMAEYVDGELSNAYLIPKDKSKLNWYQATETIDENTGLPSGLLVKAKQPGKKSFSYLPAAENPDLIAEDWSNLYFNLRKKIQKNGKWVNSDVPARYNPYEHSSNSMLNDQFTAAYQRDNLVTVKMYVPISEDNGAYRAQWSKDPTGWSDWKSGIVAGKIAQQKDLQRRVYLSRYAAPVEIVPDSEVAQAYKSYLEGTDVAIPDNVVSPNLLSELKKAGVPIEESGKVKYSVSDSNAKSGIEYDKTSESYSPARYSLSTWSESDYVTERQKASEDMAKTLGVTVEKASEYIDSVNSIAKMVADDKVRLGYEASPGRSAFVSNAEYGGSIDFSTICKKRRLFTGTFEAIQNALPNTALTADEILEIRKMMKDKGYEVSCGLCYVEGSRTNMGQFTKQFIERYKATNPAYVPNMAEMNTATGQEQLRKEHPEVYEAYEYFMNHYGRLNPTDKALFASQQKPKMYQMATEYKGEILDKFGKKNASVAEKNKNGGLRLQSFSDFEIIHLLDSMQVIMDMSRVGLAGQAYTKVPDFAWALGDTGLKINLSLIAKGVDENGRLILDDVEGMKESDAMDLRNRYSDNVGTILVAFTDEQLKAAMADERIDYIIPYHRSQWKTDQYESMGLPENTKDYTPYQNESYIEPVYDKNGKKQRPSNYMPNTYWDFSKSGKENAEAYLEMCAMNNRKPKFSHLLVDNGDGSYSLQPDGSTDGYWKTLIDFKMYNNDGVGVPQNPVVPNFNMEEAQRMLNEYKGGHAKFPVAQDIVDEFVSKHPDNIAPSADVQHSLSNKGEEFAPTGNYSTPLSETALEGDIAPMQETVEKVQESAKSPTEKVQEMFPTEKIVAPKSERIASGERSDELLHESLDNYPMQTVEQKIAEKIRAIHGDIADKKDLRRESWENYEKQIANLRAKYNSKKNKNTKEASKILESISRLERLKASREAELAKSISDLEARVERMSDPKYSRAMQKQAKMESDAKWAEDLIGDTSTWVDKKIGLQYATNTERRNLRDIVRDKNGNADIAKADAIDDALNGQYNRDEAAKKRELAQVRGKYADLKITKAEDAYIQMLGEFRNNPDTTLTEKDIKEYYEKHKGKIDTEKVDKVIELARQDYDNFLTRVNAELKKQGMKEIPYRQGYFPHFTEPKQNFIQKLLNWKTQDNEIPTSIAGLTETFKPTKSWQSFDKTRHSDETDYSFMKGFDSYSEGALDWIYHMDTLQKRRAVENHIRFTHSDEGIQARIKEVYADKEKDANEAQAEIERILTEAENPLNNFVQDFTTHTNILAGKKNSLDRTVEQWTNRHIYSVMTNVQNRMSANMVLANVRSALTNFIPITQSWAQVSPLRSLEAAKDAIANSIKDDGTIDKSTFLTNRLREVDRLYQTNWDKVLDKAGIMFEIVDNFSSQVIWRSKYNQNLAEGMSESEAIKNADQFAENVMAGRSKGNEPTLFNAKNPFVKAFTMFQLEVNNQYGYLFKDVPNDLKAETEHWKFNLAKGYTTAFIGAYVYNALLEKVTGSDAALDPIGIVEELLRDLGLFDDDEEEEPSKVATNLLDNVVAELPFVGGLFGGGRIPISSALPYSDDGITGFIEDVGEGNWGNIGKEIMNPILNVGLPVAGGQIKKTYQGLNMFSDEHPVSGSYTDSGNLRFPVEDTPLNRIQAGIFGQYASENAREYFDEGYAPLKEKQIQEYIDVDIPIKDYWEYREGLNDLAPLPGKTSVSFEQKVDYINSLDLPTYKKNILVNNISTRKDPIDMTSYGDYGSLEEFDFATEYPDKYAVAKSVGGYSSYKTYASALGDIKADKDANGKTITGSRKEKVIQYINGLNADYTTKIILYKAEYPSDDTYNADIINYVNNRADLTYDERVAILTELGFRVVNGNIYAD